MRIQTGQLVSLGYGKFVRSDDVVAIAPISEGRGPGKRTLVWVRGVADPEETDPQPLASRRSFDHGRPPEKLSFQAHPSTRGPEDHWTQCPVLCTK